MPVLDEAAALPSLLLDLAELAVPHEVLVVDGGSSDPTVAVARERGARVLAAPRGRAAQLAAGVAAARAPWLFLVHADCRLPPPARRTLSAWLDAAPLERSAYFRFALDAAGRGWRLVEAGQRVRERLTGLVYGDQGLVLSRATWDAVGGVPELPLMEDVALVDRVRRHGGLDRLPAALPTSARRYGRHPWGGVARNALLVTLYRLGVPPHRLARLYPPRRGRAPEGEAPPDRVVLVFAKAPRPGRVKTRLAADLGDAAAAAVYRRMGRDVVDALRGGPFAVRVLYDPPDAVDEVRAWLGSEGVEYRPQVEGDLGRRMAAAFAGAFDDGARRVAVVGTDAPAVDARRVTRALDALDHADVVLGPAADGGYWLMALDHPRPALFRAMPWSDPGLLEATRRRAREAGLRVLEVEELADVDTVADLPARYRPGAD